MDYIATQPQVEREIICGDFNTLGVFGKQSKITSLQNQLGNRFQSVIQKPYSSAIIQQLDYIFVKGLTVETAKILHLKGSDHYPITAH
jgi:endonuclease/exonuclease/phosphatase (EEP) superfamily protein YafD